MPVLPAELQFLLGTSLGVSAGLQMTAIGKLETGIIFSQLHCECVLYMVFTWRIPRHLKFTHSGLGTEEIGFVSKILMDLDFSAKHHRERW